MLGLSRNTWFLIGGALLVVVLYLGFSGDDDAQDDTTAQGTKGKRKHKSKRDKGSSGESGGVGVGKMCAKLECSEAQLTSFKDMVKEHRKNTSSQRRGLAEAYARIAAELAEETIDNVALDDAFEDAAGHRAEIENGARGVLEAMHAKLSGTQREGLAKMVARHGPSMLLSRPSTGTKAPKKGKPAKKGTRKKGMTLRSRSVPSAALGGSAQPATADPAALSRPSKAGIARTPNPVETGGAQPEDADDAEPSDTLAAE